MELFSRFRPAEQRAHKWRHLITCDGLGRINPAHHYILVMNKSIITCKRCNQAFEVPTSEASSRQFCSVLCANQAKKTEPVTYICAYCQQPQTVSQGDYNKKSKHSSTGRIYCSAQCSAAGRRKRTECLCEHCSMTFITKTSRIKEGKGKFCSSKCYHASMKAPVEKTCARCGNLFTVGKSRAETAKYCSAKCYTAGATGCVDANGYRHIYVRGRKWKEHRYVMTQKLGRELRGNENVHHINGVRHDNRPENLELWVKTQPCGQRTSDLVDWAREIIQLYGAAA